MKTLVVTLVMLMAACGKPYAVVVIDVPQRYVDEAIAGWENHGFSFEVSDEGGVVVQQTEEDDNAGDFVPSIVSGHGVVLVRDVLVVNAETGLDTSGTISMPFSEERLVCTLMHEFGHVLGMKHTDGAVDLMKVKAPVMYENGMCFWSENDEDQWSEVKP